MARRGANEKATRVASGGGELPEAKRGNEPRTHEGVIRRVLTVDLTRGAHRAASAARDSVTAYVSVFGPTRTSASHVALD